MPNRSETAAPSDPSDRPESALSSLVASNCGHLRQLALLVADLCPTAYGQANGEESAIGEHVRHVLDHYHCLFEVDGEVVDYRQRRRDPTIARCTASALERIACVTERLYALPDRETGPGTEELRVAWGGGGSEGDGSPRELSTSLERELMFLLSHTIHHMALIGVLARNHGVTLPEGFGVAPSTRRHRETLDVAG